MHNFVLVHGAWHHPRCWGKLKQELSFYGNVFTPALVQTQNYHGITMSHYVEIIWNLCEQLEGSITLIAHSFAGIVISEYANLHPNKIKELIFINGLIPIEGDSLFSMSAEFEYQHLSPYLTINHEQQILSIDPLSKIQDFMYQSNSNFFDETNFRSEPLIPLMHNYTGKKYQIPAKAIIGKNDLTIAVNDQIKMCQRQNIPHKIMASDHCPFQSSVKELTSLIVEDF